VTFDSARRANTLLGPWASAAATVELAPTIYLVSRALARGAATGTGLTPRTLPIRAIKPWSDVVFHYPHLSTIDGVLLYLKVVFV